MLDEFAFLGEDLAKKLVITNRISWRRPLGGRVVKGDLIPFIDKAERRLPRADPINEAARKTDKIAVP